MVFFCEPSINLYPNGLRDKLIFSISPIDFNPLNTFPGPLWLTLKIILLFVLFALVKAIVPRYRYDQLMKLGWKIFLPFSLFYVVLTSGFLLYFDLLPNK